MRNQPEKRLQQDCYKWFFNNYPELRGTMWHVQNEGKRTDYERSIIKSIESFDKYLIASFKL